MPLQNLIYWRVIIFTIGTSIALVIAVIEYVRIRRYLADVDALSGKS
jgi:hypothetical protein